MRLRSCWDSSEGRCGSETFSIREQDGKQRWTLLAAVLHSVSFFQGTSAVPLNI